MVTVTASEEGLDDDKLSPCQVLLILRTYRLYLHRQYTTNQRQSPTPSAVPSAAGPAGVPTNITTNHQLITKHFCPVTFSFAAPI